MLLRVTVLHSTKLRLGHTNPCTQSLAGTTTKRHGREARNVAICQLRRGSGLGLSQSFFSFRIK